MCCPYSSQYFASTVAQCIMQQHASAHDGQTIILLIRGAMNVRPTCVAVYPQQCECSPRRFFSSQLLSYSYHIVVMLRRIDHQRESLGLEFLQDAPSLFLAHHNEVSKEEASACKQLIASMTGSQSGLHVKLSAIKERVEAGVFGKGIGYYDSKNLVFMEYLVHLDMYELMKLNGVDLTSGVGLKSYQRLVYLRTILLKLGPVEKKLEYQTNKILKSSQVITVKPEEKSRQGKLSGDSGSEDALNYKPRADKLKEVKESRKVNSDGKYVAPKISANLTMEDKQMQLLQRQRDRKKAFLVRRFRDDLVGDEGAREEGLENEVAEKIKKRFGEKTAYEEDNFERLPLTKKEKFWKGKLIRNQFKQNQMEEDLKEIKLISEIFQEQPAGAPRKKLKKSE